MGEQPIKVAVIIGSVRGGRFGPVVARWFLRRARDYGLTEIDTIDLADYPLPLQMPAFGQEPDRPTAECRDRLGRRLAAADAFVVVTPEYNHSAPASLKNAIDWYLEEWMAKPVALICYGAMGGGLRAAEHLRHVFAEVHATTIRDTISFHNAWAEFSRNGEPASPEGSEAAAKHMLDQLMWWAEALREARTKRPYSR